MTKKNDLQAIAKHWAIDPSALQGINTNIREFQSGLSLFAQKSLERTFITTVRDGVAIIPIQGVITPRFDLFTLMMGGTALDMLARDIQTALDDQSIHAILLDVDSPGGVANGPSELADIIRRASNTKPIWAYVGRTCCSAAYWLASAANRIVVQETAMLGSIGVVATTSVQEQPDADGYKQIEIVSSNAKNKRPDPRTIEGQNTIRAELDALEQAFINTIAQNRGLSPDTVKEKFGQGGTLMGDAAVKVGMADALGDYESTLTELINQPKNQGVKQMDKTKQSISQEQIDVYRAEGAAAERARILALDDVAVAGHEDLLATAKADPTMTAEKLALAIVKAEKAKGSDYLANLKQAEKDLPQVSPSATVNTAPVGATPEERAEHTWANRPEIRQEFEGDKEAFIAYFVANENGQIKIQNKGE